MSFSPVMVLLLKLKANKSYILLIITNRVKRDIKVIYLMMEEANYLERLMEHECWELMEILAILEENWTGPTIMLRLLLT